MAAKHLTCLIVTQDSRRVRKIAIPYHLLWVIFTAAIICILGIAVCTLRYMDAQSRINEFTALKKTVSTQEQEISELLARSENLHLHLRQLETLDRKLRVLANLEPETPSDQQFLGVGGPIQDDIVHEPDESTHKKIISTIHRNMDQLLSEATHRESSFNELVQYLSKRRSVLAATPSIWPVLGFVTSEFGYRLSPFTGKREFHAGIDISTKIGKEIIAPADGIVVDVSDSIEKNGIGILVRINHGNGIITSYGHLLKSIVKKGQHIKRNDVIAYVGNSGRSTGPHLHYAVTVNGVYVNPQRYLL